MSYEYRWVTTSLEAHVSINKLAEQGWRVVPGIYRNGCVLMEREAR